MKLKNRKIIKLIFTVIFVAAVLFAQQNSVLADWWQRGDSRPTPPNFDRDGRIVIPTEIPNPTSAPTSPPVQPTATPRAGGPNATPTTGPGNGGGSSTSTDDPCVSGKSFTGPYCGWSPSVDGNSGGSTTSESPRIGGGPRVLGLSYTGGEGITWSDIISLTGILCLALYARSKMSKEVRV